jgi:hypothetical protein
MGDVVAIANVGEFQTTQSSEFFFEREDVRQRLAGMIEIGKRVDDRKTGPASEFIDSLLGEGAGNEDVCSSAQVAGDVLQRLALADHADLRNDIAAKLLHGEFEGHARTQRGFFKKQRGVTALERGRIASARLLDLFREFEHAVELFDGEIEVMAEVDHASGGGQRLVSESSHEQSPLNVYSLL